MNHRIFFYILAIKDGDTGTAVIIPLKSTHSKQEREDFPKEARNAISAGVYMSGR